MFVTTRTLSRAGLLAKLSNWWRRGLVILVTKNLMVTLVELSISGNGRNLQKEKHHCNTLQIRSLRQRGKTQSSPQWRYMKTHLAFAKKAPKGRGVTTIDIEGDKSPPIIRNGQMSPPIFEILAQICCPPLRSALVRMTKKALKVTFSVCSASAG